MPRYHRKTYSSELLEHGADSQPGFHAMCSCCQRNHVTCIIIACLPANIPGENRHRDVCMVHHSAFAYLLPGVPVLDGACLRMLCRRVRRAAAEEGPVSPRRGLRQPVPAASMPPPATPRPTAGRATRTAPVSAGDPSRPLHAHCHTSNSMLHASCPCFTIQPRPRQWIY